MKEEIKFLKKQAHLGFFLISDHNTQYFDDCLVYPGTERFTLGLFWDLNEIESGKSY